MRITGPIVLLALFSSTFPGELRADLFTFNPGGHVSQTYAQSNLASTNSTNYGFLAPSNNSASGTDFNGNASQSTVNQSAIENIAQTIFTQTTNETASASGPYNGDIGNSENLFYFTPLSDLYYSLSRSGASGNFTTEITDLTHGSDVLNVSTGANATYMGQLHTGIMYEVTIKATATDTTGPATTDGQATFTVSNQPISTPEPSSLLLAVVGLVGMIFLRSRSSLGAAR